MKKNLLFVFTMLCALSFFTACSDDDKNEPEAPVLLKGSQSYSGDKLSLKYGDSSLLGKSITFATEDGKTGTIKMEGLFDPSIFTGLLSSKSEQMMPSLAPGVVPGEVTTTLSVNLTQTGNKYTFEGTDTNNGRELKYVGEVDSAKCTFAVNVKMPANKLTGTWNMAPIVPGGIGEANVSQPIYTVWESGVPFKLDIFGMGAVTELEPGSLLSLALGIMPLKDSKTGQDLLLSVLKDITFQEDGNIVATYSKGTNIASPQWLSSPVNIAQYYVKDNTVYLQLNLAMIFAGTKTKAGITDLIPAETLTAIFTELMPMLSIGIPLTYSVDGSNAKVYVGTELTMKLMGMITPLLQNEKVMAMILESVSKDPSFAGYKDMVKGMLEQLPVVLDKTTKIELGINLVKK